LLCQAHRMSSVRYSKLKKTAGVGNLAASDLHAMIWAGHRDSCSVQVGYYRGGEKIRGIGLSPPHHTHLPSDVVVRPSPWWPLFISVTPHHRPCYHITVGRERQPITTPRLYSIERHGIWVSMTHLFTTVCTSVPNSQSTWTIATNWVFSLLRLSVTNPVHPQPTLLVHQSASSPNFPQNWSPSPPWDTPSWSALLRLSRAPLSHVLASCSASEAHRLNWLNATAARHREYCVTTTEPSRERPHIDWTSCAPFGESVILDLSSI
jgi:hypothetical protein